MGSTADRATGTNSPIKENLRGALQSQWFILFLVVIGIGLFTGWQNPRFFIAGNLTNITEQMAVLGLVAAGATILIISGNFDISVGAMIGLSASVMAILMSNGVDEIVASAIGVLICVACSALNGVLSIMFRTPSFVISLAMIGVYHGIALFLTDGVIQTIYGQFEWIGATKLLDVVPMLFVVSTAGFVFVHVLLTYTQLGRRVYAIGANPRAAALAGISVRRNTVVFFALNGVLVGLAAVLLLSRLGSALPSTGSGLELRAIGAVVIGGVSIAGGSGKVVGTFMGVLLMGVISNSLNMLRVDPFLQEVVFGALIVAALGVGSIRYWFGARAS